MLTKINLSLKNIGAFGNHSHKIHHGDHLCHFYESADILTQSVCEFIVPGITRGDGIIIIATAENLQRFQLSLEKRSIDVHQAKAVKRLIMLDAHETLAKFMVNGMPDAQKFENSVGKLVADFKIKYLNIRAFGEMVNILWEENNLAAAIRLEELWNELNSKYHFSLLCGYSEKKFKKKANLEALKAICNTHTHMITEGHLCVKA